MPHNATTAEEVALSFRQMKITTLTLLYDEEGPHGEQHCVSIPMSSEYQEVLNDARQCLEEYLPNDLNSYKLELKHEISKGRWATVHPRAFADLVGNGRAGELEFKLSARPARNRESTSSSIHGQSGNTSTRSSNAVSAVPPPDYATVIAQPTPRGALATKVLNTPIIPIRAHEHEAFCDRCQSRIFTIRYKCTICDDFDYCVVCIGFAPLEHGHHFAAIINSNTWLYRPQDSWRITDPGRATETPAVTGTEPIHEARCDVCGITPIVGTRYKCADCPDWDACQACLERSLQVHPEHTFIRVTQPGVLMPASSLFHSFRRVLTNLPDE